MRASLEQAAGYEAVHEAVHDADQNAWRTDRLCEDPGVHSESEDGMTAFDQQVAAAKDWFASPRFAGIVRLYSPREVAEQQGTIFGDYTVARRAAEEFYARLRELFEQRKQITTFGPYSPGQAVSLKRMGIEGIYLGGWATSAKGSSSEDPGPDLASYPLNQVPDEAAGWSEDFSRPTRTNTSRARG